jgi:hypothetical protein
MTGDAVHRLHDALETADCRPHRSGDGFAALCPSHDDRKPSLTFAQGREGAVVKCQANCSTEDVVAALDMMMGDLFDESRGNRNGREIVATYPYHDERGELLYEVVRFAPKNFRQRRPDGAGGWAWSLNGVRRVLYHLPRLLAAVERGQIVHVCEGEKDVEALERIGVVATCNPAGAGKWRDGELARGCRHGDRRPRRCGAQARAPSCRLARGDREVGHAA